MKKVASFLLLMIPLLAGAQSIGIKAGLIFSNLNYSSYIEEKGLVGSNFGIAYQHDFNRLNIRIEPGFVTKGFSEEFKITDNSGNLKREEKAKFKFSYFELPVLVGYNLIDKKVYAGLNAGLSANFQISSKMKSSLGDVNLEDNNTVLFDVIGGGYLGYKIDENIIASFNLRYGKGLGKVNDNALNSYNYFATFLNIAYKF